MAQFGSETRISGDVRLLLLDCFETMVELEGHAYRPRNGMREFLTHYGAKVGLPIAVISDAGLTLVERALAEARLSTYPRAIYHAGNAAEDLGGGRRRKRLDLPVADFGLKPAQALFIGDSPLDAEAARHHGVQFIRVPRSEDRAFSFVTLIDGVSRYQSQEFNLTFLDRYGRKDPRA